MTPSAAVHDEPTENLDQWLRATTDTIGRARRILLIASVVGILICISTFNLYFTWLRDVVDRKFDLQDPVQKAMFENAMRIRFSDTAVTNIPILGVRIFSGDVNLVGAISVNVVIAWMASAFRKSNHSLGRLLQRAGFHYHDGKPTIPANSEKSAPTTYLFHALSSEYLFIGTRSDALASRLMHCHEPPRSRGLQPLRFIIWLPAVALLCAFAADLISMFFTSVLVPTGAVVSKATKEDLWLVRIFVIPLIGLVYAIAKTAETAAYEKDSQQLFEHLAEAMEPHWQRELAFAKDPSPRAEVSVATPTA